MRLRILCGFVIVLAIIVGIITSFYENNWLQRSSQVVVIFGLFGYFYKDLRQANINFYGFFLSLLAASLLNVFYHLWYVSHLYKALWLVCFGFLLKEAIRFTEYSKGSRTVRLSFLVAVGIYAYLLALHLMEIAGALGVGFQFFMYLFYYLILMVTGITALIYYLNSFSRKSVYFISFVLSLIFSNVLRDMGIFYFKDVSVEIAGLITRFASFLLVFLFFVTKERRLRLLNLV